MKSKMKSKMRKNRMKSKMRKNRMTKKGGVWTPFSTKTSNPTPKKGLLTSGPVDFGFTGQAPAQGVRSVKTGRTAQFLHS